MDRRADKFPSPSILKQALEREINIPLVFKGYLKSKSWYQVPKNIDSLLNEYGNCMLDFRVVSKFSKEISWEGNAQYIEAKISHFIAWQTGQISSENPFCKFPKKDFWAYSSYNYMNLIFPEKSKIMQYVNWKTFGYPEVTGKDSSFWIGSKGANTPCHVDSYGCNLVAQVIGRKKWILFPPDDDEFLYPTRIPYEESSIFSSVNMLGPNLSLNPSFKNAHPHVVILESDDVLFVPKGWWHFVSCLDPITVSINAWIKLESDVSSQLTESAVRVLMTSLISSYEPEGETWINPKEELVTPEKSISYIISTLKELKKKEMHVDESSGMKITKSRRVSDVHSETFDLTKFLDNFRNVIAIKPLSVMEVFASLNENDDKSTETDIILTTKKIMNCFVHPEVIKLICQKLKEL